MRAHVRHVWSVSRRCPTGDARAAIGIWHGVQNLGTADALMLNFPSRAYDYADPDHYRLPFDSPEIPYQWATSGTTRLRSS